MVTARRPESAVTRADLARSDLRLRLAPLVRAVGAEIDRWAAVQAGLVAGRRAPAALTERHARLLLDRINAHATGPDQYGRGLRPSRGEADTLDRVADHARDAGITLPLAELAARGLDDTDLDVLLVVAAPAFDTAYAGLFAYLQDSFEATAAGPGLAVRLLATSPDSERRVSEAAGAFGRLRAWGLVCATSADRNFGPLLRPAAGVLELLRGSSVDLTLLGLPAAPVIPGRLPGGIPADDVAALSEALRTGRVDLVGIWGAGRSGAAAAVAALCGDREPVRVGAPAVDRGLQQAALAGTICLVEVAPGTTDDAVESVVEVLAHAATPAILVAEEPLRLTRLATSRRVAELRVPEPARADLRAVWTEAFPGLHPERVDDLARRFVLARDDVEAVAALDRAAAAWDSNGWRPTLDELATRVSRPRSAELAAIRTPRRSRDLLVLPDAEWRRVLQIADDFRAWPHVAEAWRLDRFGSAGITALFAGPPGTGKTLAAEVIAGEVGLDLMVVDLSLLVSKWVGETEKNLDAVFTEAGASHCVLFFDEADTLFGRRGEVSRGADRYANLEVGYLLQRLDRYDGLVVLATNLRDQLDEAFTRRFQHLVHFPRPGPVERRRLWDLVLGPPVVLAEPVDLDVLTEVDLTGAGIAAVVRSAALAAYHDDRDALGMADLVRAVSRQFQREGRLVPRELLGSHAEALS